MKLKFENDACALVRSLFRLELPESSVPLFRMNSPEPDYFFSINEPCTSAFTESACRVWHEPILGVSSSSLSSFWSTVII